MRLSELEVGKTGKVNRISDDCAIRRRLQDIGLISGTAVECIMKSPLGDPCAYSIRGAVFALRKKDADSVIISITG